MAQYDPAVIQAFADKLYSRANGIVATSTVVSGLAGGVLSGAGMSLLAHQAQFSAGPVIAGIAGAVFCGVLGNISGSARAFALKLQAQSALCQMKIEANTQRA